MVRSAECCLQYFINVGGFVFLLMLLVDQSTSLVVYFLNLKQCKKNINK